MSLARVNSLPRAGLSSLLLGPTFRKKANGTHLLEPTMAVNGLPLKCDHGLRRQAIVSSLLADVFQGRLRAGQHLVTQDLATRFGVSHTPIREALIALAGNGIIDLMPNRGAVVRQVTTKDIREICHVRRVLECEAIRSACGRIDAGELSLLALGFRQMQAEKAPFESRLIEEARGLDSRLHDRISGSSGNAFLANELSRLKILFRALRDVSWKHDEARNNSRRITEESREHLAIVEGLLAGDRREAALAMSRHIMAGARYWSRALRDAAVESTMEPSESRASREERPR
jgi:DNA-binding GntR family transcriptional regulator